MKVTMVLVTCLLVQVSAHTYAQRVTLNKKNSSIYAVLEEIQKQTNYNFLYDPTILDQLSPITVTVENATLDQVLNECFKNQPYDWAVHQGFVTIAKKPESTRLPRAQQQLRITGRVVNASDNRPLSGVSIRVKGTQTASSSDANGNFSITVPPSGATLVFTFLGMDTQEIGTGSNNTVINVRMQQATSELEEVAVTVQARRRANTEIAVLDERRKASIVQDAISAQQIERTGSITTTQALQRVSGVTVTDDKYVAVRGLGDRSVIGQLNGVRLASSDPDRSAIPLDLVPASLLDNITIYKTVTPDKPADAASGIVELKTKSIPDSLTFEIVAQSGFNSNIGIGGNYNSFWNSDMGIWGNRINNKNLSQDFLNLGQQYPNGLYSIQRLIANSGYSPALQQEADRINGIMHEFDPVLATQGQTAPLNQLYSATFGNNYKVFRNHRIGIILGGNYYRRITNIYDGDLTQWSIYQGVLSGSDYIFSPRNIPNFITTNRLGLGRYQTYKEHTGVETLNYGMLGGLAYRFNPRHEISFQYMGSWGGETRASNLAGAYQYTGMPGRVNSTTHSLRQSFRTLQVFNLQGEHKLWNRPLAPALSYNLSTSSSGHNDPDYRFANLIDYRPNQPSLYAREGEVGTEYEYVYRHYALGSGYVYGFGPFGVMQADPNGRRWRQLNEDIYNYKADLSVPFRLFGHKQEFKTGFNYLNRDRTFGEHVLFLPGSNFLQNSMLDDATSSSPTRYSTAPLYDVDGDLNRLVSPEIVGIRPRTNDSGEGDFQVGGFLYNIQKSPNNYHGFFQTNAFYGMLDLKLTDNLRLAGGVRFELTNVQSQVDTANLYLDPSLLRANAQGELLLNPIKPNAVYKQGYKPFYSVNATYTLNELMNFRMAFNTTLARPELREITNVFEFDAFQMGLVVGNPNLINQNTTNLDFRWEWFPNPGEVIAVSAFRKQLQNQLVKVYSLRTEGLNARFPEYPVIGYQNDPNTGRVWGLELELVKDLGTLWTGARGFHIGSNMLIAQSEVKKTPERLAANWSVDRNAPENSPLFEQAPYSVNAWLNYENKRWGTDITTTFNIIGERLVQINLTGEPDLYSRPVPFLDIVITQRLSQRLTFKGFAKNILNPDIKTVYANPSTGGKWYGREYVNRSFKQGSEIVVGFSYNLF
ncbi:TonB-dependent receptor [Parapedobacter composti]|nr:TonB-dependent receptor [Parapedobacter composti]